MEDMKEQLFRIRDVLKERGATPQYLADCMGVSRQYINNILSERHTASVRTLVRIAHLLDVPVASLFADYLPPCEKELDFICPNCGYQVVTPINSSEQKNKKLIKITKKWERGRKVIFFEPADNGEPTNKDHCPKKD